MVDSSMGRSARLAPLGLQRLRVLDCLGGEYPWSAGYFDLADDAMLFAAFRDHVFCLSREWSEETDPLVVPMLAAARLLCGEIAAAETILTYLPSAPIVLDHGAGFCQVAAFSAMGAALPIPDEWSNTRTWLRGSDMERKLRAWLSEHADRLEWNEEEGHYRFAAERKEYRS